MKRDDHVMAFQLFQRFAAHPLKVSVRRIFRKTKEFAPYFKRHFLNRHLRVRVLHAQPRSRSLASAQPAASYEFTDDHVEIFSNRTFRLAQPELSARARRK